MSCLFCLPRYFSSPKVGTPPDNSPAKEPQISRAPLAFSQQRALLSLWPLPWGTPWKPAATSQNERMEASLWPLPWGAPWKRASLLLLALALFFLTGLAPALARTTPTPGHLERIALLIGHNQGGKDLKPLRYAQRDARRMAHVLKELGGYSSQQITLLVRPKVAQIRQVMKSIARRVHQWKKQGKSSLFLFYYSGHARQGNFQLGSESLSFREVIRFARALPTQVRILLVDSCFSGEMLRAKGARRSASIRWLPPHNLRTRGLAILTSSEATGRSFESDRFQGSLFTSNLLTGLRGAADRNNDQRVSFAELYHYVYQQTLARSVENLIEVQRPSHRMNLRGQGSLYLTYLGQAPAVALFPASLHGHCFLYRGKELIQEFEKPKGKTVRLGLATGTYRLKIRRHGWIGVYPFRLARQQPHPINPQQVRWRQLSLKAQLKGGPGTQAPLALGFQLRYTPLTRLSLHGIGALLSLDSGRWLRVGLGYRFAPTNPLDVPYQTHVFSLHLALGYGLGLGPWWLWLGAAANPQLILRQSEQDSFLNAGFTFGPVASLDYYLLPELSLRLFVGGGVHLVLFAQNHSRLAATLDLGFGLVWRP